MYQRFRYQSDRVSATGWDAYADTYAKLLVPDTVYYLTKEVIHRQIAALIGPNKPVHVLDLNCGTGNDFPFFLARGWKITGCDGSVGMLNKAYERYRAQVDSGQVSLFLGQMETLDKASFPEAKFDLIYSVTGGYSYVCDDQVRAVNQILGDYLTADGLMVTAHLGKFCLSDTLYQLAHARFHGAFVRMRRGLQISIKGEEFRMYLRGRGLLKRLSPDNLKVIAAWPLLSFTPPYQTGYRPGKTVYRFLRALELRACTRSLLAPIADQVVVVSRRRAKLPPTEV